MVARVIRSGTATLRSASSNQRLKKAIGSGSSSGPCSSPGCETCCSPGSSSIAPEHKAKGTVDRPLLLSTELNQEGATLEGLPDRPLEEDRVSQPQNVISQAEESVERKDPAVKVGYWLAVLFPAVGVLVGTSLISRNSDKGPRIVVISVISIIIWIALVVAVDELSSGLIAD